jgi:hypothetical protein
MSRRPTARLDAVQLPAIPRRRRPRFGLGLPPRPRLGIPLRRRSKGRRHRVARGAVRLVRRRRADQPAPNHEVRHILASAALEALVEAGSRSSVRSRRSLWSAYSYRSAFSVLSFGSILSAGSIASLSSAGSFLSIASTGSILSFASSGSILSIGSSGSILSVGGSGSFRSSSVRDEDTPADTANVARLSGLLAIAAIAASFRPRAA